ncbi:hypothetical protein [Clostridium botulinum]|uniref:hypothetical protein n=1 Tax=Clostridium botulinum TaxID=1491 RepID=UPI0006A542BA|nr:hypothetical protein [Clostridium botulinum]KOC30901.1 hypothetical protein ADU81_14590 [Clostridium botulinum]
MKKWIVRVLILIIYSFPYVYFGMYKDLTTASMVGYGLMLVALTILLIICEKTNNLVISILGNITSFVTSYILVSNLTCEKAGYYFKPFTAIGCCKFDTTVILIVQLITIAIIKKCKEK